MSVIQKNIAVPGSRAEKEGIITANVELSAQDLDDAIWCIRRTRTVDAKEESVIVLDRYANLLSRLKLVLAHLEAPSCHHS